MIRPPRSTSENGSDGVDGNSRNASDASSAEEYRVGPGRPPKEFQFKPGESGNPKGAKRKSLSLATDLKAVLERALSQKVTLRHGQKERMVTMATAGIEQLVAQFAKGDRHARRDILVLAHKLGVDLTASPANAIGQALATDVAAEDEALLANYLRRHGGRTIGRDRRSSSTRKRGATARGERVK
jgi:Family of unknown function (DUF5681)